MTIDARKTSRPRRIAVIGAGISGIATAAHILKQNTNQYHDHFEVVVFERSAFVGGVWQYDDRQSPEPPFPQDQPPKANLEGDTNAHEKDDYAKITLKHAPPGPAYLSLKNNVPTSLMHSTLQAWPEGTEEYVRHEHIVTYIRQLAESTNVNERVRLNTSVDSIWKDKSVKHSNNGVYDGTWHVRTSTLHHPQDTVAGTSANPLITYDQHEFDAIIVASGHYHIPRVPPIPGLNAWKEALPDSITHAKSYRKPDGFEGKRVLIIGSSASAHDIAKEIGSVAETVYVSARGGQWDIAAPEPAVRVGGVEELIPAHRTIRLKNDITLTEIDHVIVATGYLTSYPFLGPRLQNPSITAADADDEIVVTQDGLLTHNLHKDIWYIPDPSLAFVGVVFHTSTFSLFDFQAQVVARVLAGLTKLPPREAMRTEYNNRKENTIGKPSIEQANLTLHLRGFHSLMGRETEYMDEILSWVNQDAARLGVPEMKRLGEKWHARYEEIREQIKTRRLSAKDPIPTGGVVFGPLGRVEKEESDTALLTLQQVPEDVQGVTDRALEEAGNSEDYSSEVVEYVLGDSTAYGVKRKQGDRFSADRDEETPRKLFSRNVLSTEPIY